MPSKSGELSFAEKVLALQQETISINDMRRCADHHHGQATTSVLAHRLVRAGKLVRHAPGLFAKPGQPVAVRSLILWYLNGRKFQLAYRSAMAAHGFGAPPERDIFIKIDRAQRDQKLTTGHLLRFFERAPRLHREPAELDLAGIGRLPVADLETTLLDGLESPQNCGGLVEVCRFMAWRRGQWDIDRLLEFAPAYDRAITRRLGLLLEWMGDPSAGRFAGRASPERTTPSVLDPSAPRKGESIGRWRVKVNVATEPLIEALRDGLSSGAV